MGASVLSCTHHDAFVRKIRAMNDSELVDYYHGLNERIKEIENYQKLSRRSDDAEHDRIMSQSSFFMGGEGEELVMKQRAVQNEIDRRNMIITP
jgi:glutamate racemase